MERKRVTRVMCGVLTLLLLLVILLPIGRVEEKEEYTPFFELLDYDPPELPDEQEDFENEKIERALLEKANKIEGCLVTHYCAEKYKHICGTGDGIGFNEEPVVPYQTCAVDRKIIPIGATVIVDKGGEMCYYLATDTGVTGDHIDLCVEKHKEALDLGYFYTDVYWLED